VADDEGHLLRIEFEILLHHFLHHHGKSHAGIEVEKPFVEGFG